MVEKKKLGFLQRWSNKKISDQKSNDSLPISKIDEASLTSEEESKSDGDNNRDPQNESEEVIQSSQESLEGLSDVEVLKKLKLPDPETMKAGDDFKAFLAKTVPEHIRKRALRKLWVSNPILANLDGMNEYDDDFTLATSALEQFATNYVVGKGFRGQFKAEEPVEGNDLVAGDLKSSSIRTSDRAEVKTKDPNLQQDLDEDRAKEKNLDDSEEKPSEFGQKDLEMEQGSDQLVNDDNVDPDISNEEEGKALDLRIKPKKMVFKD